MIEFPNVVNVASGSNWTKVGEITLPQGRWGICYGGAFGSNATGMRRWHLGTTTSAGRSSPTSAAVNGDQTRFFSTIVYETDAPITLNLYASQNSGSTLQAYGSIQVWEI